MRLGYLTENVLKQVRPALKNYSGTHELAIFAVFIQKCLHFPLDFQINKNAMIFVRRKLTF